jgi:hypothetical protein
MAQEFRRRLIAGTAVLNTEKSFELKAMEGGQKSLEPARLLRFNRCQDIFLCNAF